MKDRKCDGNRFDCTQIDLCGPGATCAINNKKKTGTCKCDEGLQGNGINCFFQNGTLAENGDEVITVKKNFNIFFFSKMFSLDVNEHQNPVLRVHTG